MPHELEPNIPRIVEAVLCIVSHASASGFRVTQHHLAKSLFMADVDHLARFGRPITFDNYVATEEGPVPRRSHDFLMENPGAVAEAGGHLPWTRQAAPELGRGCYAFDRALRAVDGDILSPSDLTALRGALEKAKAIDLGVSPDLAREHPAYLDAWRNAFERGHPRMDYGRLCGEGGPDRAAELAFLSRHV